jgi:hypothetical protein
MKTYLTYNHELRAESDPAAIANLKRKGWTESPPPDFDAATESISFEDGAWVKRNLTAEEIAAAYEAANPPAKQFQVRIWLARNGINPDAIPQIIEAQTSDGPDRWEALERWRTVQDIPITHPMVGQLFGALQQAGGIPDGVTLEHVWQEILNLS